jgi:hypothetical protein
MPLSTLHARLGGLWKAIILLASIFMTGLTIGAGASGILGIPARVIKLEATADTLHKEIQSMRYDVSELRSMNKIQLCLQIAEKTHSDWRKCL